MVTIRVSTGFLKHEVNDGYWSGLKARVWMNIHLDECMGFK